MPERCAAISLSRWKLSSYIPSFAEGRGGRQTEFPPELSDGRVEFFFVVDVHQEGRRRLSHVLAAAAGRHGCPVARGPGEIGIGQDVPFPRVQPEGAHRARQRRNGEARLKELEPFQSQLAQDRRGKPRDGVKEIMVLASMRQPGSGLFSHGAEQKNAGDGEQTKSKQAKQNETDLEPLV